MAIFNSYVCLPESMSVDTMYIYVYLILSLGTYRLQYMIVLCIYYHNYRKKKHTYTAIWVYLKIGYTPNYSHLVGIMIINHWV